MSKLIYLGDSVKSTIKRIMLEEDLDNCGLTVEKVTETLNSFQGDEIACSVFLKKYALRDKNNQIVEFTLEEAKDRWAKTIAGAEKMFPVEAVDGQPIQKKNKKYFRELYDHFLPAGRQMFALGNAALKNLTFTNCYVTDIEDDSIEGIFDCAKKLARTYSYGGGIGTCMGTLRPKKSEVSNSARFSTGSVSFMELYSLTTGLIGQSGRRGALMLTMPVDHPDIEDFIEIKHDNVDRVKHANISIKLTDKFMKAVIDGKQFKLSFTTPHETISKTVDARELWNKIITSARDSAEPGLLFWDQAVRMSPSDTYPEMKIHSTNPCVSGDTWVFTENGPEQARNLVGGPFKARVDGKFFQSSEQGFFKTGKKELFSIETKDGFKVKVTKNHKILVKRGGDRKWVEAQDLSVGDQVVLHDHRIDNAEWWPWRDKHPGIHFEPGYLLGLLVGDGTVKTDASVLSVFNGQEDSGVEGIKNEVLWCIKTAELSHRKDFNGWHKVSGRDEERITLKAIHELAAEYGITRENKAITDQIEKSSSGFHIGFLRGMFDADGSVQGDQKKGISVRLSQSNLENLERVQRMLARFGIISTVYKERRPAKKTLLPNGRGGSALYDTKAQHELVISNNNIIEFDRLISFSHTVKMKKLKGLISGYKRTPNKETFTSKIVSIDKLGVETVYDAQVPGINAFDANGIYVHNCGEQLLDKGSACVLSSLLLHTFVKNPFTDEAEFDFELFQEMTRRGVRHLDNVVELNFGRHGLEEQERSAKLGRRIGMGFTGIADTFAAMGLRYDSQEAYDLAEKISEAKMVAEYNASIDLAIERGSFGVYDPNLHFTRGFCATLPEEIQERAKKFGLRNIAISTIAPNGSLSIIAQCSSGIEPIFSFAYQRFVEMGGKRKSFTVRHQGLSRLFTATSSDDIPKHWVSAHEIDYKYRVKLQGMLQKYIDASISSTINLPKDVTAETVGQIYMEAWREGLKGITVYREGSREGVLVTEDYADMAGVPMMDTSIKCVRAEGGDKFYIMVSYKEGSIKEPYQVFVLNYKRADRDTFIKTSNAIINMLKEKGVSSKRIDKYSERSKDSLAKLTRFISLSMKTGHFDECVGVLEEYAFAGTLVSKLYEMLKISVKAKKTTCPSCSGENLRMEEGCSRCLDCGWSGCQ